MNFYQGDQYSIIFKIETCTAPLDLTDVELIEFTIGTLSKSYPLEVTYNDKNKTFLFPVTQAETFQFSEWENYQARIKYISGNVYGTPVNKININETLSQNII